MAMSKAMDAVMEDQAFCESLDTMQTKEEVTAAFAAKGIDIEKELNLDGAEAELNEAELEDVAGGIALATLATAVALGWKIGSSAGILVRSYYDAKKYGNPYRSYSKSTVNSLLKKLKLI